MITILDTYDLVYRFKDHKHIQITQDGIIINTKNNAIRKLKMNGRSVGIWVTSKKFMPKSKIRESIEKIPKEKQLINDPYFGSHNT